MESVPKILDCSSITSTIESFELVVQKPIISELESCIGIIDGLDITIEEALYDKYFRNETSVYIFDKIAFFHITRTNRPKDFMLKGILPTRQVIDQVWDEIKRILKCNKENIDVDEIRLQLESDVNSMYYLKLYLDSDGPYAFLTRETAFNKDYCSHFVDAPEIVVDICRALGERLERLVLKYFKSTSSPCIVKFITTPDEKESLYIGSALKYLYLYSIGESNGGLDIGFDGNGSAIKPSHVISVEERYT